MVKLNLGVDYPEVLACLDGCMHIAVGQIEEYVNGELKRKYGVIQGCEDTKETILFTVGIYFL